MIKVTFSGHWDSLYYFIKVTGTINLKNIFLVTCISFLKYVIRFSLKIIVDLILTTKLNIDVLVTGRKVTGGKKIHSL